MTTRVRFVLVPFLLMLLIQTILIQTQFIYAQDTIKPVRINGNITDSFLLLDHQPQVAAFGNNVYIAWVSKNLASLSFYLIFLNGSFSLFIYYYQGVAHLKRTIRDASGMLIWSYYNTGSL